MSSTILGRTGRTASLTALLFASALSSSLAAQVDVFGVRAEPLGAATLSVDTTASGEKTLSIHNLGSSGQDGVRVDLSSTGTSTVLVELGDIEPAPGSNARIVARFIGTVSGGPQQVVATYTSISSFDPTTGTSWHTSADFSGLGAQTITLSGTEFGSEKFSFAGLAPGVGTGTKASAEIIYFTADNGERICSMGSKPVVVKPAIAPGGGSGPGLGSEEAVTLFDHQPEFPTGSVDSISAVEFRFFDVLRDPVEIHGIQTKHLDAFVTGIDTAQVETNQAGSLKVSNLGSSGCDGVSIDTGGPGVTGVHAGAADIAIDLTSSGAPIVPGSTFDVSVDAAVGGSSEQGFMGVNVVCPGAAAPIDVVEWECGSSNLPFVWFVDASLGGSSVVTADPATSTFEVASFFPNLAGVAYGTDDDGDLGLSLRFAPPVTLFLDGAPLTVDELTLAIDASVAWQVTELETLHVQTATLPSFTIDDVTSVATPYTNLGAAKSDGHVTVLKSPLSGGGTLDGAGALGGLMLRDAPAGAPSGLFVGTKSNPVPFKGGTLLPVPVLLQLTLPTGASGELDLPFAWPAGVPAGFELVFQCAVHDTLSPQGVWLSNGLRLTSP